mgnify:CR=1 FL=1
MKNKVSRCRRCTIEFTGHHRQEYCSKKCQKLSQDEYTKNYWTKHRNKYYKISEIEYSLLIKDGCKICEWKQTVDIHHIDSNRINNDINNLVCLCPNHHALISRGIVLLKIINGKYIIEYI